MRAETATVGTTVPAAAAVAAPENESTEQSAWIAYAVLAGAAAVAVGAIALRHARPAPQQLLVSTNARAKTAVADAVASNCCSNCNNKIKARGETVLDKRPDPFHMQ